MTLLVAQPLAAGTHYASIVRKRCCRWHVCVCLSQNIPHRLELHFRAPSQRHPVGQTVRTIGLAVYQCAHIGCWIVQAVGAGVLPHFTVKLLSLNGNQATL